MTTARPDPVRVAVTGALSRPGLAVIRDLGRAGMAPLGLDRERPLLGLHSRWSEPYRRIPVPFALDAWLALLAEARADVLLPMASWLVAHLVLVQEAIAARTALNLPSADAFDAAYNKARTVAVCEALGIPAPRTVDPADPVFPLVVKPSVDVGAALGVAVCRDPGELARALARCARYAPPLVQDYIPGGPETMRTVVLLLDRDGHKVAHFTTRKLWTRPLDGGVTTLSVSTDDTALVEQMLPWLAHVGWRGPAEVELKLDPRDGQAKVIEINPRFPGYVGFAARCGLNLPALAVRAALGEPVAATGYAVGRTYLNPALHLKAVAGRLWHGPERAAALAQALRDSRKAPWISLRDWTDPAPKLAKIADELRAALTGTPSQSDEPGRFPAAPG